MLPGALEMLLALPEFGDKSLELLQWMNHSFYLPFTDSIQEDFICHMKSIQSS
jgi:hypothetical protein